MNQLNNRQDSQLPTSINEQDLNYLAIWFLEICYGQIDPSQAEIEKMEDELRNICLYENLAIV